MHLPPTWACLYLCVAGFHFNGSNLRMRQCHFYEVGVKKIYSLFQKAFFFFPREKGVESLRGVLWSQLPHSLCPPSLCSFCFMSLCWRTKPGWWRTWISPWSVPSAVGTTDLGSFSLRPFPPLSGPQQSCIEGVDGEMFNSSTY